MTDHSRRTFLAGAGVAATAVTVTALTPGAALAAAPRTTTTRADVRGDAGRLRAGRPYRAHHDHVRRPRDRGHRQGAGSTPRAPLRLTIVSRASTLLAPSQRLVRLIHVVTS